MKAKKYNPKTRDYETIEVPEQACVNCIDIDQKVQCASCGKEIPYISTVTSSHIRTFGGFGFAICKKCAEEEQRLTKENLIPLD